MPSERATSQTATANARHASELSPSASTTTAAAEGLGERVHDIAGDAPQSPSLTPVTMADSGV